MAPARESQFFPVLPSLTLQFVSQSGTQRPGRVRLHSSFFIYINLKSFVAVQTSAYMTAVFVHYLYLSFQWFPFLEAPISTRPQTDCGSRITVNIGDRSDLRSSEGGVHMLKPPQDAQNAWKESPYRRRLYDFSAAHLWIVSGSGWPFPHYDTWLIIIPVAHQLISGCIKASGSHHSSAHSPACHYDISSVSVAQ